MNAIRTNAASAAATLRSAESIHSAKAGLPAHFDLYFLTQNFEMKGEKTKNEERKNCAISNSYDSAKYVNDYANSS
jgi:hypothetical protein